VPNEQGSPLLASLLLMIQDQCPSPADIAAGLSSPSPACGRQTIANYAADAAHGTGAAERITIDIREFAKAVLTDQSYALGTKYGLNPRAQLETELANPTKYCSKSHMGQEDCTAFAKYFDDIEILSANRDFAVLKPGPAWGDGKAFILVRGTDFTDFQDVKNTSEILLGLTPERLAPLWSIVQHQQSQHPELVNWEALGE
jgi:hypothetical protein